MSPLRPSEKPDVRVCGGWGLLAWLAVRAVRATPRESLLRVAVGVVAVIVMLTGLSLEPTALARSERLAESLVDVHDRATADAGVLVAPARDYFDGEPVSVVRVALQGSPGGTEVGLGFELPELGQVIVSARMQELLESNPRLGDRYPGQVSGLLPEELQVGPRSLVAWVGTSPASMPADAGWLQRLGGPRHADVADNVPGEVKYALPMLVVGFVLPLFALLALLGTLGGARREKRLASLRLIGLSDRQAKVAAALEAAGTGTAAAVLGSVLFFLLRGVWAEHYPVLGGVWAQDLRVSWLGVVGVWVLFPLLGTVASWVGLRALTTSPLGVERRTVSRPARRWPLLLLASGGLVLLASSLSGLDDENGAIPVTIATVLIMTGWAASIPLLTQAAAAHQVRHTPVLPFLVSARRLQSAPERASRVAVGLTMLVMLAGPLLVFFPLIADAAAGDLRSMANSLGPSTLVTRQGPADDPAQEGPLRRATWARAEAGPGVATTLTVHSAMITSAGATRPDLTTTVAFVDCVSLEEFTKIAASSCERGLVLPDTPALPWTGDAVVVIEKWMPESNTVQFVEWTAPFALPDHPVSSNDLAPLLNGLSSPVGLVLPLGTVPEPAALDGLGRTVMTRPTSTTELELARTSLVKATGLETLSIGEQDQIARRTTREFLTISTIAAGIAIAIATLATVVSLVELRNATIQERRLLAIGGAPRRLDVLVTAHQALTPTLIGLVPGAVLGLVLAGAFTSLLEYASIPLPVPGILGMLALALGTTLLAAVLVSLSARIGGDSPPRTE